MRDTTELEQITQEFRFSSNGDGPLHWVAGLFYSDTQRDYQQVLPTPGFDAFFDVSDFSINVVGATSAQVANGFGPDSPFNSILEYDLEQISLFGELNFELTERLEFTLGGRYYDYEETRTITSGGIFANGDSGVIDETESDGFTPRALLNYDLNDNVSVNAQVSRGFRLGGVNDPLNATICSDEDREIFGGFQDYDDETLTNYEIGVKGSFNVFQFNAALFYADIEDLQVTLDAGTCSSRISFNVPDAHTAGAELELKAKPNDNWEFSLAASLLEAEFDSTVTDGTGAVIGGIEDGNRLASVPEVSGAATATYTIPSKLFGNDGDLYFSATVQYVGDRITQPSDQVDNAGVFVNRFVFGDLIGGEVNSVDLELPSYELVNFNTGFQADTWEASIYVNNAFNEDALLSFDRERGGLARTAFRVNQPRTLGVTFRKNF